MKEADLSVSISSPASGLPLPSPSPTSPNTSTSSVASMATAGRPQSPLEAGQLDAPSLVTVSEPDTSSTQSTSTGMCVWGGGGLWLFVLGLVTAEAQSFN